MNLHILVSLLLLVVLVPLFAASAEAWKGDEITNTNAYASKKGTSR